MMMSSLTLKRLIELNPNLHKVLEGAFNKPANLSNKYFGERKINNHIGTRNSLFPSQKSKGLICLESNLERAHALSLERNEDIDNYRTQSVKLYLNEKEYVIPDFLVLRNGRFEIHEIKANLSIINEKQKNRFNLIQLLLEYHSIKFRKFDHKDLPDHHQINTLNHCYQKVIRNKINHHDIKLAEEILCKRKFKTINDIYQILFEKNISAINGDYLIFYNRILGY